MSRTNETKNIKWHETCKCECRLDAIVCNDKQRWNNDKCWCELIDKGVRDKGYAWNPSNCECDCDKSCNIGEYLDYENCTCKKRLVDTLVEEYNETIDEEELKPAIIIPVKNNYKHNSCIVYIVLFSILELVLILLTINTGIVKKKMFLDMIMFIKQLTKHINEGSKTLKIEITIFTMTLSISKNLMQSC